MHSALRLLTAALGGYLLGTAPSADVACRLIGGPYGGLRASGTGNPGGVNARRVLGRRMGTAVITADIVKGIAACSWGHRRAGDVARTWPALRLSPVTATRSGRGFAEARVSLPASANACTRSLRTRRSTSPWRRASRGCPACAVRPWCPLRSPRSPGSRPASCGGDATFRTSGARDRRRHCPSRMQPLS
jgi:Glycerol-3-phosphate acyltransferase